MKEGQNISKEEIIGLKKAGKVARGAKILAREITKIGTPLVEIAEKIENFIRKNGAQPAFPTTLSINEVAAHATPTYNSEEKAHGLIKVDLGVHVDGLIADTAITIDLENSKVNKDLISTAKDARDYALNALSLKTEIREIGKIIEDTIKLRGFSPIINLSGHSIDPYELHSGITIPNCDNGYNALFAEGVYAIEPFATTGIGRVVNGKLSGIYHLESDGQVRDSFAREVLKYIKENYKTLPFCLRWLVKKFGPRAQIAMKRIEEAGLVHHYPQLIEKERKPVSQAEHTIILTAKEKIITT